MAKDIGKNISKNFSGKYSQKFLNQAKQSPNYFEKINENGYEIK